MKNSKKLLALLLALVMALSVFAACTKDEDDASDEKAKTEETGKAEKAKDTEEEKESGNDEDTAVKAAMETFCDGYEEMNVDKMLEVTDEGSTAYEKIQAMTEGYAKFEEIADQLSGQFGDEGIEIAEMMIDMIDFSAKIKEIEVDGDTANVLVELSNSDFSTFAEDFQAAYSEAVTAMLTEDVLAQAEELSEEEQYEFGIQLGLDAAKEVLKSFELETVTQSGTMVLEKIDGEWLIVDTEA